MELLGHLLYGLQNVAGVTPILVVIAGVIVGIVGGAMPGMPTSVAGAMRRPWAFGMSASMGVVVRCARAAARPVQCAGGPQRTCSCRRP